MVRFDKDLEIHQCNACKRQTANGGRRLHPVRTRRLSIPPSVFRLSLPPLRLPGPLRCKLAVGHDVDWDTIFW